MAITLMNLIRCHSHCYATTVVFLFKNLPPYIKHALLMKKMVTVSGAVILHKPLTVTIILRNFITSRNLTKN